MKLQHLPIGARFEYEGKVFVKTGPLTAASEEGGQKIIPRYAVLKPLDVPQSEAPATPGRRLDPARVRKAFDVFYEAALKAAEPAQVDGLAAARQRFLDSL